MTTDITELAQSMSIERIKQIALGGQPTIGEKERLAITALYFHKELQICTKAFQTAGLNQLAAEEAPEKALRANVAQHDHINLQQDRIEQLEKGHEHAAKQTNSWRRLAKQSIAEQEKCVTELDVARQRIAELESRTVTVKSLTHEVCYALKAEGLADVLKDAAEYAPLTAGQWETLTKNWHQTFIGLSGSAVGIKWEGE